jgi:hypothetical protein
MKDSDKSKRQRLISVLLGITMFTVSGFTISWLRQYYDWIVIVPSVVIIVSLLVLGGLFFDAWRKRRSID